MIQVYRLSSSRYPDHNGHGAALHGGRWNPRGKEVIYTSASRSLAALEVLVHYAVLPRDFVITPIQIPDRAGVAEILEASLPPGWNDPEALYFATQQIGAGWLARARTMVLKVPSAVIPQEANFVLNVAHRQFASLTFLPGEQFYFDPRLK